jgi:hypothetical protein
MHKVREMVSAMMTLTRTPRILIPDPKLRRFVAASGQWTRDETRARDFGNAFAAIRFISEKTLNRVHLVVKIGAENERILSVAPV